MGKGGGGLLTYLSTYKPCKCPTDFHYHRNEGLGKPLPSISFDFGNGSFGLY